MNDTFETLRVLVMKDYKLPPERVTPDTPLASLGIDSLSAVELFWNLEETFHVRLAPEAADLASLGDLARHVDALVAAQAAMPVPTSLRGQPVRTS